MLAQVLVPPDAVRAIGKPPGTDPILDRPSSDRPRTIVERVAWWVLPGTAEEAQGWLREHPPTGARLGTIGGFVSNKPGFTRSKDVERFLAAGSWPAGDAELQLAIADSRGGGAVLRATATVEWTVPRSPSEYIPSGTELLELEARASGGNRKIYVIRGKRAARIAGMIDSLPARQPRQFGCRPTNEAPPTLRLRFRRGVEGSVVAAAEQQRPPGFCHPFELRVRGRLGLPLVGGERVIGSLAHLLS
jgi:hypothetical protein